MPNHPLVSVIIPTKNEERNIVRCLKSVKNQDYNLPAGRQGVEIIIIDNRSTDRTVELARPYTKKVIIAKTANTIVTHEMRFGQMFFTLV